MEKRHNTRVLFDVSAIVKYKNKEIKGNVVNLSLNGILMRIDEIDENIPKNTDVSISIIMEGTSSQLMINLEGIVVRSEKSDIALEFKSIDLDSFMHLKNIVVYNEGNEEKIMKEFYNTVRS